MLNIIFHTTEDTLIDIDNYFNYNYEDHWFEDDMVKKMIYDIDKSEVLSNQCILSPVLGQIPPEKISGGVKALILLLMRKELEIWATACGDNCAKWIIDISEMHDITIVLEHVMQFPKDFRAYCVNNGYDIKSLNDYRRCILECL